MTIQRVLNTKKISSATRALAHAAIVASVLLLQGCPLSGVIDAVSSSPVRPGNICTAEGPLPQPHLRPDNCGLGIVIDPLDFINSVDLSTLDLTRVKIDLSASSVDIVSSNGWGSLTLDLSDSSKVSQPFQWTMVNDNIIFTNPGAIESLVLDHVDQLQLAALVVDDIQIESTQTVDTFVAETKVDNVVVNGISESWYSNDASCDGVFPDVQLCP